MKAPEHGGVNFIEEEMIKPVLFTSQRPLSRCENIKTVYDAYDGPKEFRQMDWWRRHPDIPHYHLMVTDEIPVMRGKKIIFIPHGIEGTKTYGLDQPRRYATPEQCQLINYAVGQSAPTVGLMAAQLGLPEERVLPLGMPRTDNYIRKKDHDKTMYFYAPTFGCDEPVDWSLVDSMLHDDEILIVKPHMLAGKILDREYHHIFEASNEEPSASYLMSCNVLITNYSSIMLDGLCARIPTILFSKNKNYLETRGMYYEYPDKYSSYFADDEFRLIEMARNATWLDEEKRSFFCGACDGHSTERLIKLIREMNE